MIDIWDKNFKEIESMDLTINEISEDTKKTDLQYLFKDLKHISSSSTDKILKSMPCDKCNLKDICKYVFDIKGELEYDTNVFDIKIECKIRKES